MELDEASPEWLTLSATLDPNLRDGTRLRIWCRAQLASTQLPQFESCNLKVLGNGAALLLTLTTECGGDSCDTQGWVRTAQFAQFLKLPIDVGGTVESTPDGTGLLFDSVSSSETAPASSGSVEHKQSETDARITTQLFDLATRSSKLFASCFSMQLSPKGKYFLCRDIAANVLAIPVRGGSEKLIAASGVGVSQIDIVPYAYIWPEPVTFPTPNRLAYTVRMAGDAQPGALLRELDWTE